MFNRRPEEIVVNRSDLETNSIADFCRRTRYTHSCRRLRSYVRQNVDETAKLRSYVLHNVDETA